MRAALAFCLAVWAGTLAAQEDRGLRTLHTREESRGWASVGRLDVAGQGFCSAALISPDLVLTAAHCLYSPAGQRLPLDSFTFRAGLRGGLEEAARGIHRAATHPGYDYAIVPGVAERVAFDIALLELDLPIRSPRMAPYPVAVAPRPGAPVGIVSYARGREEMPSLEEACRVIGAEEGVMILDCEVDYGASGAPVFAVENGVARVVSVISAMAMMGERRVALGPLLEHELAIVLRVLDSATAQSPQRFDTAGERASTGAKFVRPGQ